MRRTFAVLVLLFLVAATLAGQEVKTIAGVAVRFEAPGDKRMIWVKGNKLLQMFVDSNGKSVVLNCDTPGEYTVAYADPTDPKAEATYVTFTVTKKGVIPPIDPPDPIDPPIDPAKLKNLRVLVLFEEADAAKLPAGQRSILYGKASHDALNAKCAMGPDGKTKEWYLVDQDTSLAGLDKKWDGAKKAAKDAKGYAAPWCVLYDNGTYAYNGALPKDVAAWTALLDKYAPKTVAKPHHKGKAPMKGGK